jgi:hypothetical protein
MSPRPSGHCRDPGPSSARRAPPDLDHARGPDRIGDELGDALRSKIFGQHAPERVIAHASDEGDGPAQPGDPDGDVGRRAAGHDADGCSRVAATRKRRIEQADDIMAMSPSTVIMG